MNTDDKYSELRLKAEKLLQSKGTERCEKFYEDIEKLVEELNVHQIELEMQNQELQKTTQKLQAEQEKFFDLYENAPIAYFTLNNTGNIYGLNNEAANLLGMPKQAFHKTSLFIYLTESSKQVFTQFFKKVFQSDNIEFTEIEFIDRNSEIIHAKLNAQSYFDYDKNKRLCRCAVTNITEEKKLKQIAEQEKNKFKHLADNSFDIINILNEQGLILFESNATERILGYKAGERIGQIAFDYVHPDDVIHVSQEFQTLVSEPNSHKIVEFRFKHKKGNWKWLEASGQNFLDNPKINGLIINSRDITERKEAEKQKNYLSAIIENTENICVIKDLDLKVIATNESFVKAAGKKSINELIGKTDAEVFNVSPDEEPIKGYMTDERNAQKLKKGEKILREEIVVYPDKSIKTVLTTKFPIFDDDNKILATANISTDITKLKETQQKIKQKDERFRLMIKNSNDTFVLLDKNGNQIFVSNSVEKLTGLSQNSVKKPFIEFIHPDDIQTVSSIFKEILIDDTKKYTVQYRHQHKEKGWIWLEAIGQNYLNNHALQAIIVNVRDISKQKEREILIETQNSELQKLNEDKNRFMRILGHDLRSPFNSLLGFANLLNRNIEKYDKVKIKKMVTSINEVAENTYNLLNDLLLWSKSQSGILPYEPKEELIETIFQETKKELIYFAQQKDIEIKYFEAEKTSLNIDKNMFKTIFRNLISNAIKFSHRSSIVNVYCEKIKQQIIITFSDNGVGIRQEDIKKLWNRAKPFSTQGTENEQGTGLGLLLVKEFVEKHNGKVWVESEYGNGCDFKISIPIMN